MGVVGVKVDGAVVIVEGIVELVWVRRVGPAAADAPAMSATPDRMLVMEAMVLLGLCGGRMWL